jgi:hypothetical protein
MVDEGDHLSLRCGEIVEVVLFDALACKSWLKKKLTDTEQVEHVAFDGCFTEAKEGSGIDFAVRYCGCLAPKMATMGEQQMAGKTEEEMKKLLMPLAKECAATSR